MLSSIFTDSLSFATLPIEAITSLGFYGIAGIFAIFSAILYYHWNAYSTDASVTRLTLILYFSTTIPLLIIMGIMTWLI